MSAKLPPVPLPTFDGSDLESFLNEFERWLRLSGVEGAPTSFQFDWLVQCTVPKFRKVVERVVEEHKDWEPLLLALAELFPRLENDLTLRVSFEKLPSSPFSPEPAQVKRLLVEFEEVCSRTTLGALGAQEKYLLFSRKVHPGPSLS